MTPLRTIMGVGRSLATYYGNRDHIRNMTRFYSAFVREGDLVFDIGSHVGDRVLAFRRLGCTVVAVEPQPALLRVLRLIHGRSKQVKIVAAAISDRTGEVTLNINTANPTVSTASNDFIRSAQNGAVGWEGQTWDKQLTVKAVTLDSLIADHGSPAFVKIDVEGLEDRVLHGLSSALPALSFEFTTHERQVALGCLARLRDLGSYRYNACLGESFTQAFPESMSEQEIAAWLQALPEAANSGDIYCFKAD